MKYNKVSSVFRHLLVLMIVGILVSTSLFSQEGDLLSKVRNNDIDAVKSLLAAGANVNQEDDMMGYTGLALAKSTEMMNVLLSAGADINHHDKRQGYTPLMWSLNSCKTDAAKFLIEKGADIKAKSNDGSTALILACGCSEEIVKDLLAKGADINVRSDKGNGVITQCANTGLSRKAVSYEFIEFLLSEGADIDETNTTDYYRGYTPLCWAIMSGKEELVSFLVKHGASVNIKLSKDKTPLLLATEAGNANIIELLKANGAK